MNNLKVLIFLLSVPTLFYAPAILNMRGDSDGDSKESGESDYEIHYYLEEESYTGFFLSYFSEEKTKEELELRAKTTEEELQKVKAKLKKAVTKIEATEKEHRQQLVARLKEVVVARTKTDQGNEPRPMKFSSKFSLLTKLTLFAWVCKPNILESIFKNLILTLNSFLGNDKTNLRWAVGLTLVPSLFLRDMPNLVQYLKSFFYNKNKKLEKPSGDEDSEKRWSKFLSQKTFNPGLLYLMWKSENFPIVGKYLQGPKVRLTMIAISVSAGIFNLKRTIEQ